MGHRTPAKDRKRRKQHLAKRRAESSTRATPARKKETKSLANRAIATSSIGQVVSARPIDDDGEIYWVVVTCKHCSDHHRYCVRPRERWFDKSAGCDSSRASWVRFRFSASTLAELTRKGRSTNADV